MPEAQCFLDPYNNTSRRSAGQLRDERGERAAPGRRPLVTSTYIADEVITLVRMRIGHAVALEVGDAILSSKWCRMLEVDEGLRQNAWSLFARYDDQEFSFTDCASFAIMHALGLEQAFTFDRRDFSAAGFGVLPAGA
jgi:predicted nucleic acid-binding protein